MEAEKNIFGQYLPYVSPILTEDDKVVVDAILNQIVDNIQSQIPMNEFIKETSNLNATIQHVVGIVNDNIPEGVTRADGANIRSIIVKIIKERVEGYYATVTVNIIGDGSVTGNFKIIKGESTELTVIGNVVFCSEDIVEGKIILSNLQENITIDIEFEPIIVVEP